MEYEDRITIWAPEGLALDYTLAGLGSRYVAQLIDALLRVAVLGGLIAILAVAGVSGTGLVIVLIVGGFLALFGYPIAFEVWGAGRTPGKRWSGLRVVMADGQPVRFAPSAVRNLMLVVDVYGTAMVAGIVSIVSTTRNQRLGDLAAGTIVVRERRTLLKGSAPSPRAAVPGGVDATAVTAGELAAVRDFLARRDQLAREARDRVARTLAERVGPKVGGVTAGELSAEELLETIAAAKGPSRYGSPPRP